LTREERRIQRSTGGEGKKIRRSKDQKKFFQQPLLIF